MGRADSSTSSQSILHSDSELLNTQRKQEEHTQIASEMLRAILLYIVPNDQIQDEFIRSLAPMKQKIIALEQADEDGYKKICTAIRVERKVKRDSQPLKIPEPSIRALGLVMYAQILYSRIEEMQTALHVQTLMQVQTAGIEQKYTTLNSSRRHDDKKKRKHGEKKRSKTSDKSEKRKRKLFS